MALGASGTDPTPVRSLGEILSGRASGDAPDEASAGRPASPSPSPRPRGQTGGAPASEKDDVRRARQTAEPVAPSPQRRPDAPPRAAPSSPGPAASGGPSQGSRPRPRQRRRADRPSRSRPRRGRDAARGGDRPRTQPRASEAAPGYAARHAARPAHAAPRGSARPASRTPGIAKEPSHGSPRKLATPTTDAPGGGGSYADRHRKRRGSGGAPRQPAHKNSRPGTDLPQRGHSDAQRGSTPRSRPRAEVRLPQQRPEVESAVTRPLSAAHRAAMPDLAEVELLLRRQLDAQRRQPPSDSDARPARSPLRGRRTSVASSSHGHDSVPETSGHDHKADVGADRSMSPDSATAQTPTRDRSFVAPRGSSTVGVAARVPGRGSLSPRGRPRRPSTPKSTQLESTNVERRGAPVDVFSSRKTPESPLRSTKESSGASAFGSAPRGGARADRSGEADGLETPVFQSFRTAAEAPHSTRPTGAIPVLRTPTDDVSPGRVAAEAAAAATASAVSAITAALDSAGDARVQARERELEAQHLSARAAVASASARSVVSQHAARRILSAVRHVLHRGKFRAFVHWLEWTHVAQRREMCLKRLSVFIERRRVDMMRSCWTRLWSWVMRSVVTESHRHGGRRQLELRVARCLHTLGTRWRVSSLRSAWLKLVLPQQRGDTTGSAARFALLTVVACLTRRRTSTCRLAFERWKGAWELRHHQARSLHLLARLHVSHRLRHAFRRLLLQSRSNVARRVDSYEALHRRAMITVAACLRRSASSVLRKCFQQWLSVSSHIGDCAAGFSLLLAQRRNRANAEWREQVMRSFYRWRSMTVSDVLRARAVRTLARNFEHRCKNMLRRSLSRMRDAARHGTAQNTRGVRGLLYLFPLVRRWRRELLRRSFDTWYRGQVAHLPPGIARASDPSSPSSMSVSQLITRFSSPDEEPDRSGFHSAPQRHPDQYQSSSTDTIPGSARKAHIKASVAVDVGNLQDYAGDDEGTVLQTVLRRLRIRREKLAFMQWRKYVDVSNRRGTMLRKCLRTYYRQRKDLVRRAWLQLTPAEVAGAAGSSAAVTRQQTELQIDSAYLRQALGLVVRHWYFRSLLHALARWKERVRRFRQRDEALRRCLTACRHRQARAVHRAWNRLLAAVVEASAGNVVQEARHNMARRALRGLVSSSQRWRRQRRAEALAHWWTCVELGRRREEALLRCIEVRRRYEGRTVHRAWARLLAAGVASAVSVLRGRRVFAAQLLASKIVEWRRRRLQSAWRRLIVHTAAVRQHVEVAHMRSELSRARSESQVAVAAAARSDGALVSVQTELARMSTQHAVAQTSAAEAEREVARRTLRSLVARVQRWRSHRLTESFMHWWTCVELGRRRDEALRRCVKVCTRHEERTMHRAWARLLAVGVASAESVSLGRQVYAAQLLASKVFEWRRRLLQSAWYRLVVGAMVVREHEAVTSVRSELKRVASETAEIVAAAVRSDDALESAQSELVRVSSQRVMAETRAEDADRDVARRTMRALVAGVERWRSRRLTEGFTQWWTCVELGRRREESLRHCTVLCRRYEEHTMRWAWARLLMSGATRSNAALGYVESELARVSSQRAIAETRAEEAERAVARRTLRALVAGVQRWRSRRLTDAFAHWWTAVELGRKREGALRRCCGVKRRYEGLAMHRAWARLLAVGVASAVSVSHGQQVYAAQLLASKVVEWRRRLLQSAWYRLVVGAMAVREHAAVASVRSDLRRATSETAEVVAAAARSDNALESAEFELAHVSSERVMAETRAEDAEADVARRTMRALVAGVKRWRSRRLTESFAQWWTYVELGRRRGEALQRCVSVSRRHEERTLHRAWARLLAIGVSSAASVSRGRQVYAAQLLASKIAEWRRLQLQSAWYRLVMNTVAAREHEAVPLMRDGETVRPTAAQPSEAVESTLADVARQREIPKTGAEVFAAKLLVSKIVQRRLLLLQSAWRRLVVGAVAARAEAAVARTRSEHPTSESEMMATRAAQKDDALKYVQAELAHVASQRVIAEANAKDAQLPSSNQTLRTLVTGVQRRRSRHLRDSFAHWWTFVDLGRRRQEALRRCARVHRQCEGRAIHRAWARLLAVGVASAGSESHGRQVYAVQLLASKVVAWRQRLLQSAWYRLAVGVVDARAQVAVVGLRSELMRANADREMLAVATTRSKDALASVQAELARVSSQRAIAETSAEEAGHDVARMAMRALLAGAQRWRSRRVNEAFAQWWTCVELGRRREEALGRCIRVGYRQPGRAMHRAWARLLAVGVASAASVSHGQQVYAAQLLASKVVEWRQRLLQSAWYRLVVGAVAVREHAAVASVRSDLRRVTSESAEVVAAAARSDDALESAQSELARVSLQRAIAKTRAEDAENDVAQRTMRALVAGVERWRSRRLTEGFAQWWMCVELGRRRDEALRRCVMLCRRCEGRAMHRAWARLLAVGVGVSHGRQVYAAQLFASKIVEWRRRLLQSAWYRLVVGAVAVREHAAVASVRSDLRRVTSESADVLNAAARSDDALAFAQSELARVSSQHAMAETSAADVGRDMARRTMRALVAGVQRWRSRRLTEGFAQWWMCVELGRRRDEALRRCVMLCRRCEGRAMHRAWARLLAVGVGVSHGRQVYAAQLFASKIVEWRRRLLQSAWHRLVVGTVAVREHEAAANMRSELMRVTAESEVSAAAATHSGDMLVAVRSELTRASIQHALAHSSAEQAQQEVARRTMRAFVSGLHRWRSRCLTEAFTQWWAYVRLASLRVASLQRVSTSAARRQRSGLVRAWQRLSFSTAVQTATARVAAQLTAAHTVMRTLQRTRTNLLRTGWHSLLATGVAHSLGVAPAAELVTAAPLSDSSHLSRSAAEPQVAVGRAAGGTPHTSSVDAAGEAAAAVDFERRRSQRAAATAIVRLHTRANRAVISRAVSVWRSAVQDSRDCVRALKGLDKIAARRQGRRCRRAFEVLRSSMVANRAARNAAQVASGLLRLRDTLLRRQHSWLQVAWRKLASHGGVRGFHIAHETKGKLMLSTSALSTATQDPKPTRRELAAGESDRTHVNEYSTSDETQVNEYSTAAGVELPEAQQVVMQRTLQRFLTSARRRQLAVAFVQWWTLVRHRRRQADMLAVILKSSEHRLRHRLRVGWMRIVTHAVAGRAADVPSKKSHRQSALHAIVARWRNSRLQFAWRQLLLVAIANRERSDAAVRSTVEETRTEDVGEMLSGDSDLQEARAAARDATSSATKVEQNASRAAVRRLVAGLYRWRRDVSALAFAQWWSVCRLRRRQESHLHRMLHSTLLRDRQRMLRAWALLLLNAKHRLGIELHALEIAVQKLQSLIDRRKFATVRRAWSRMQLWSQAAVLLSREEVISRQLQSTRSDAKLASAASQTLLAEAHRKLQRQTVNTWLACVNRWQRDMQSLAFAHWCALCLHHRRRQSALHTALRSHQRRMHKRMSRCWAILTSAVSVESHIRTHSRETALRVLSSAVQRWRLSQLHRSWRRLQHAALLMKATAKVKEVRSSSEAAGKAASQAAMMARESAVANALRHLNGIVDRWRDRVLRRHLLRWWALLRLSTERERALARCSQIHERLVHSWLQRGWAFLQRNNETAAWKVACVATLRAASSRWATSALTCAWRRWSEHALRASHVTASLRLQAALEAQKQRGDAVAAQLALAETTAAASRSDRVSHAVSRLHVLVDRRFERQLQRSFRVWAAAVQADAARRACLRRVVAILRRAQQIQMHQCWSKMLKAGAAAVADSAASNMKTIEDAEQETARLLAAVEAAQRALLDSEVSRADVQKRQAITVLLHALQSHTRRRMRIAWSSWQSATLSAASAGLVDADSAFGVATIVSVMSRIRRRRLAAAFMLLVATQPRAQHRALHSRVHERLLLKATQWKSRSLRFAWRRLETVGTGPRDTGRTAKADSDVFDAERSLPPPRARRSAPPDIAEVDGAASSGEADQDQGPLRRRASSGGSEVRPRYASSVTSDEFTGAASVDSSVRSGRSGGTTAADRVSKYRQLSPRSMAAAVLGSGAPQNPGALDSAISSMLGAAIARRQDPSKIMSPTAWHMRRSSSPSGQRRSPRAGSPRLESETLGGAMDDVMSSLLAEALHGAGGRDREADRRWAASAGTAQRSRASLWSTGAASRPPMSRARMMSPRSPRSPRMATNAVVTSSMQPPGPDGAAVTSPLPLPSLPPRASAADTATLESLHTPRRSPLASSESDEDVYPFDEDLDDAFAREHSLSSVFRWARAAPGAPLRLVDESIPRSPVPTRERQHQDAVDAFIAAHSVFLSRRVFEADWEMQQAGATLADVRLMWALFHLFATAGGDLAGANPTVGITRFRRFCRAARLADGPRQHSMPGQAAAAAAVQRAKQLPGMPHRRVMHMAELDVLYTRALVGKGGAARGGGGRGDGEPFSSSATPRRGARSARARSASPATGGGGGGGSLARAESPHVSGGLYPGHASGGLTFGGFQELLLGASKRLYGRSKTISPMRVFIELHLVPLAAQEGARIVDAASAQRSSHEALLSASVGNLHVEAQDIRDALRLLRANTAPLRTMFEHYAKLGGGAARARETASRGSSRPPRRGRAAVAGSAEDRGARGRASRASQAVAVSVEQVWHMAKDFDIVPSLCANAAVFEVFWAAAGHRTVKDEDGGAVSVAGGGGRARAASDGGGGAAEEGSRFVDLLPFAAFMDMMLQLAVAVRVADVAPPPESYHARGRSRRRRTPRRRGAQSNARGRAGGRPPAAPATDDSASEASSAFGGAHTPRQHVAALLAWLHYSGGRDAMQSGARMGTRLGDFVLELPK